MLSKIIFALAGLAAVSGYVDDDTTDQLLSGGNVKGQIGLWINHDKKNGRIEPFSAPLAPGTVTDNPPSSNGAKAYCFAQAISHFDKTAPQGKFCQRYWVHVSDSYKPGGPVVIYDPGEGKADPYFSSQIGPWSWADEFHGIFIVLEHRFYGWSVPTPDLSTDSLRFLNSKDALQDTAEFIKGWVPSAEIMAQMKITDPSIIRANRSPYIYYGGSYAGGRAAFLRKLYPDLIWGAVASSGVTEARTDFSDYFLAPIRYGEKNCINAMKASIKSIDGILDKGGLASRDLRKLFGVEVLEEDDFGSLLRNAPWKWQSRSWRTDGTPKAIFANQFCPTLLNNATQPTTIANGTISVPASVVNWAAWVKQYDLPTCQGADYVTCYGTHNDSMYAPNDVSQTWRIWTWQTCTQYGYMQVAPPPGKESIVSKRVTLDYDLKICRQAYPPGKYFQVPPTPDVNAINSMGGRSISLNRLMFITGQADPWRPVTCGADIRDGGPFALTSFRTPRYEIPDGVHCSDGLTGPTEPQNIKDVHTFEKSMINWWLMTDNKKIW